LGNDLANDGYPRARQIIDKAAKVILNNIRSTSRSFKKGKWFERILKMSTAGNECPQVDTFLKSLPGLRG
jgi:hypothetical protein